MNAIKTLLAASTVAAVASTAGATTWNITMNANSYLRDQQGNDINIVLSNFNGTWDDETGAGSWHGTASIPVYAVNIEYDQTFTMSKATSFGRLNMPFNCSSDDLSACSATGLFQGNWHNTIGSGYPVNNKSYSIPHLLTPADGATFKWALDHVVVTGYDEEFGTPIRIYTPIPMNITLRAQAPAVPLPAAAWLFSSGLIGLVGAARKRKSA